MYKLLIVDDEPLVQVGIKSMLDWSEYNIDICGIAMNGQAAYSVIEEQMPDIVITDIKMPIMTGLELIKKCRENFGYQKPSFIILTNYEDFSMAKEALKAQVVDYLLLLACEKYSKTLERVPNENTDTMVVYFTSGSSAL